MPNPNGADEAQEEEDESLPTVWKASANDDPAKSNIIAGLYKRAITQQQREELDQMVNDMRYNDLKRQKKE